VRSLPSQNGSFLSEMRHDFLGKQRHRLLHKRGVHQPSLVEIADELVKTILGLQLLNPRDAVLGVAEYAQLAVHIGISDAARGAILAPATDLLEQQQMLQGVLEGSDPWLLPRDRMAGCGREADIRTASQVKLRGSRSLAPKNPAGAGAIHGAAWRSFTSWVISKPRNCEAKPSTKSLFANTVAAFSTRRCEPAYA